MKRIIKRITSLMIASLMVVSVAVPAFGATENNIKLYSDICLIGDSAAVGYGIDGHGAQMNFPNWWNGDYGEPGSADSWRNAGGHFADLIDGSFGDLIRDAINARYMREGYSTETRVHSLGCVGQRIVDVLWTLGDEDYAYVADEGKAYHNNHQGQPSRWNGMVAMHELMPSGFTRAQEKIRQSSLVMVSIGSNDLIGYPVRSSTNSYQLDYVDALRKLTEGLDRFTVGFPTMVKHIKELNPDCDVVLCGLYNPYSKISLGENDPLMIIGKVATEAIKASNLIIKATAKEYGCSYADILAVGDGPEFTKIEISELSTALQKLDQMDNHPQYGGHRLIYESVLKSLPSDKTSKSKIANGAYSIRINGNNVGTFVIHFKGLGWTIKSETEGYLCIKNGKLVMRNSSPTVWSFNKGFSYLGKYLSVDEQGNLTIASKKASSTELTLIY